MPRFPYFPYSYYKNRYYDNSFRSNYSSPNIPPLENTPSNQNTSPYLRKTFSCNRRRI